MSTSAAIIEKTEMGYRGIYCNFDGYHSEVGEILKEHYQYPAKITALIDLGDISLLGERINPIGKHSWKYPEAGTTVAYHRDREEEIILPRIGITYEEVAYAIGADYNYIFEDGKWLYGC